MRDRFSGDSPVSSVAGNGDMLVEHGDSSESRPAAVL